MSDWDITDEQWPAPTSPDPSDRSILIVDDDPSIRSMLGFLFDDEGFVVREAADGQDALDAIAADPPDAMVLDLMMPRVDGYGVLRERRERQLARDTRIVVLTAKSDPADAVWCWELGADEFVNKPVDPEKLLREVQMLLKRTPGEVRARRREGLAEAKRLDAMEAAFEGRRRHR
ncbi:response regulator transcription factor [Actinospongicola halichondriae]|uniref:response regulator transcription factor n=1 Tax=Actinospongicola halichondriae TaxID=3236844 RepID=UPI003D4C0536